MTLLERYTALALLGIATADMTEDESEAKPSEESVDTARNVKAAAAINRAGLKIEDAEHHVGRKRTEWTGADLDKLREWIKTEKTATTQA